MALRDETRSAGRHRRTKVGRHRAPRGTSGVPTATSSDVSPNPAPNASDPATPSASSEVSPGGAVSSAFSGATSSWGGTVSSTSSRTVPSAFYRDLPSTFSSAVAGAFASGRGRAALLTAALGVALATGVAGGTAAATAADKQVVPVAGIAPAETTVPDPIVDTSPWKPPAGGEASAAQHMLKPKPRVVVTEAPAPAVVAWVNPNPSGRVTSCFGPRWGRLHAGVDIAGPHGSPILTAGAGTVVRAGAAQGYGNAVLIDHGNGYLTHYGHMSAIAVHEGQRVEPGDRIGDEGSTGHSTGPHLHFEVHQGFYKNPVEPVRWLHERGVTLNGCEAALTSR